ncbi:MAG TPA: hypothetical protein PLL10_09345 [Elusimicrobiales bacterium]|nr:hypothetical protein [Elusimicrobiales bacterium]
MLTFARLRRAEGFTFLEVQASLILIAIAMGALAMLLMNNSTQTEASRKINSTFTYLNYTPSTTGNFLLVTELSTGTTRASYSAAIVSASRNDGTSQTVTVMLYPN